MPANSPSPPRIAVIGGGISGLAAAFTLRERWPEAAVSLFETTARLGGSLCTRTEVVQDGDGSSLEFRVEQGADSFLIDDPATLNFLQRAGVADHLIETNRQHRRAFVVFRGRLIPTPPEFALLQPRRMRSLLTTPLLSWTAKLRAAAEICIPKRRAESEESLADFARRRFGSQVYARLIEPLVAGIFTADGERLSLQAALPKFARMEAEHGSLIRAAWKNRKPKSTNAGNAADDTDAASGSGARYGLFVAPRLGLSQLVEGIAGWLPRDCVQLGTKVTNLRRADSGWSLETVGPGHTEPQRQDFDAVILATSAHVAATLLEAADPSLSESLAAIPHASSAVVSFGFRREQFARPLTGFGFVVPQLERRPILAGSFPSVKFPHRAPPGCELLRVFLGGAMRPELVEMADGWLAKTAREQLEELLGLRGEPLFTHVARWRNAMPQYHLGHLDRVRRIEERQEVLQDLRLAGNYLHGVGIPRCLRGGEQAALRVMAAKSGPAPG